MAKHSSSLPWCITCLCSGFMVSEKAHSFFAWVVSRLTSNHSQWDFDAAWQFCAFLQSLPSAYSLCTTINTANLCFLIKLPIPLPYLPSHLYLSEKKWRTQKRPSTSFPIHLPSTCLWSTHSSFTPVPLDALPCSELGQLFSLCTRPITSHLLLGIVPIIHCSSSVLHHRLPLLHWITVSTHKAYCNISCMETNKTRKQTSFYSTLPLQQWQGFSSRDCVFLLFPVSLQFVFSFLTIL